MTTASQTPGEPSELDALVALAERHQSAGRLAEAAAAYRQIVLLRPDVAEAYNNLGNLLIEQGQLDEAAAQYEQAVKLKPSLFQAHNNLGNIFRQQGRLDEAAAQYERVVALEPSLVQTHVNLGNILRTQGKLDQAVARYAHALALRPDLAAVHMHLGAIYRKQGKLEKALASYQQAIALRPDLAPAYDCLGSVLMDQNKPDEATPQFERAVTIQPNFPEAHHNLGNALKQQGKFDQAAAHFDQALALNPDFVEVHYDRIDLKTFRAHDADLAALKSLAASTGRLPPSKMLYVHFALGKALEDVGDYRRAFEHLLEANALKRSEIDYDEEACRRDFRLITEIFDSELFERFRGAGDPSPVPIFIVGMPRSGSTLIEQILASHPQVHAAGELNNLYRVARAVADLDGRPIPFPQCVGSLDAEGFRRLGQLYLDILPALADGQIRVTDKMLGNFLRIGLIRLILPNARIIHTLRDPVDTCVSCFSKLFILGQGFSYDLAELGRFYRGYHELMEHWRSVLPAGAMLDVAYEDVVDNLEQQARRLIDFCGLAWDDRCLSFHKSSRAITTASNVQVRQPLYRSSVQRWRRYEAHLEPLLAELDPVLGDGFRKPE